MSVNMNPDLFMGLPRDFVLVAVAIVVLIIAITVIPRWLVILADMFHAKKSWVRISFGIPLIGLLIFLCVALVYEYHINIINMVGHILKEYKVVTSVSMLLLLAALIVRKSLQKKFKAYIDWFSQATESAKTVTQQSMELTREKFEQLNVDIQNVKTNDSAVDDEVRHHWNEFRDNVHDNKHGEEGIYNSKRPKEFFNTADGSIEPTFHGLSYSTFPAYFVTIGLLATFLSLALVLINAGQDINYLFENRDKIDGKKYDVELTGTMIKALGTASSKFIISIVGLVSSLGLSISYNKSQNALNKSIHKFIKEIESRLVIAQPRDQEQLAKLENISRGFGELKTGLGESLGSSLKTAISEGFSNAENSLKELSTSVTTVNDEMKNISTELHNFKKDLALCLHSVLESVSQVSNEFNEKSAGLISDVKENANVISKQLRENSKVIGDEIAKVHNTISSNVVAIIGKLESLTVKVSSAVDEISKSLQLSSKNVRENLQDSEKQFQNLSQNMLNVADSLNNELTPSINELVTRLANDSKSVGESMDRIQTAFVDAESSLSSTIDTLKTDFVTNVGKISSDLKNTSFALAGCSEELSKNIKAAQYAFSGATEAFAKSEHSMNNKIQELNVFSNNFQKGAGELKLNLETMNTSVKQLSSVIEGLYRKIADIEKHIIK